MTTPKQKIVLEVAGASHEVLLGLAQAMGKPVDVLILELVFVGLHHVRACAHVETPHEYQREVNRAASE